MKIKVLGPGCKKCEETAKLVQESAEELGIDVPVEKVTDVMEIAKHGVLTTPAVVVDDEVKCVGKVPKKEDIRGWLEKSAG
jgi:small redox-active disulfide protein 2